MQAAGTHGFVWVENDIIVMDAVESNAADWELISQCMLFCHIT